jgi:hypothetical protein
MLSALPLWVYVLEWQVCQGNDCIMASKTGVGSAILGHSLWQELAVDFVGIGIFAIIASTGGTAGKIAVALMVGFFIIAIMIHVQELQGIVGKL